MNSNNNIKVCNFIALDLFIKIFILCPYWRKYFIFISSFLDDFRNIFLQIFDITKIVAFLIFHRVLPMSRLMVSRFIP